VKTGVVAVMHGNFFSIKRILQNNLNINGTLTLTSDNPPGESFTINETDLREMWNIEEIVSGRI
jgi:hypothetical protein